MTEYTNKTKMASIMIMTAFVWGLAFWFAINNNWGKNATLQTTYLVGVFWTVFAMFVTSICVNEWQKEIEQDG